ncbi:MAG TPA: NUDIX domain-containing protein [Tenuifilaceae bacterium]|nr:NUDIX domain-containing protein [Tenuifilaceae bacterium]HPE17554.1 NUDIX domain-containing protein [Tenuifilaceae bacterium]HPJ45798.1 NUDIX domain-containing protein [Tenuifilaceae bacterium]HPQ33998.1 NUDIX domain-containing protein [Tenuifilaceae bacterium]HRX68157.1 NUDIX domain-containing protein [Tenuifilaceae bacterium]
MSSSKQDFLLKIHSIGELDKKYSYVVVVAEYLGELVWVRQKSKETWEIPGGHIEEGEIPEEAAVRELEEETGAENFEIFPLCDFSIETKKGGSYNRLFYANVIEFGKLGSYEIEEIMVANKYPLELTYELIQPLLIKEAFAILGKRFTKND